MGKEKKIVLFVIIVAITAIFLLIYRYEKLLIEREMDYKELNKIIDGVKIKHDYTKSEIINLIKAIPEYLGDSLTIYENGEMTSSNEKFNGTLKAVINSSGNMEMVKNEMKLNNLPLQYNIYRMAAGFYRTQYQGEFKTDSVFRVQGDSAKNSH
ncbi:MAG: hypothetical protein WKF97_19670 [Chitinophagaceae bacterium]